MHKSAKASAHVHNFSARAAAGHDLWKIKGWEVGLRGEMSLSYLAFSGYRESGADSLNLDVDGYRTTYLEGGGGFFTGKRFRLGSGYIVATGKMMGMYGRMNGSDFTGRFQTYGSSYRVSPGHISTAWVAPEATLAWNITKGLTISGSYSGRFGKRYIVNAGSVDLNLRW